MMDGAMLKRVAETCFVASSVTVANLVVGITNINWMAASAAITTMGTTLVGMYIKWRFERKKLEHDNALLEFEVSAKKIELAQKQFEFDEVKKRAENADIALKYADLVKDYDRAQALVEANRRLEQQARDMNDGLKKDIADLKAKHAAAINLNGVATHKIAGAVGMEPIDVGHIDDTGADLPTLAAPHDPRG